MQMRKVVVTLAVMATLAGAGCSALGRQVFQEPVVTLQDVKLVGVGITGGQVDVLLNVQNPNEFRLDATKLTYNVFVGDSIQFATGVVDSRFTVEGKKTQQVRVPINFTYAGIGAAGRQLIQSGAVDYRVGGEVSVGTPVGSFNVPYRATGRFTTMGGTSR
jgi:LEA14-like dessication related protein